MSPRRVPFMLATALIALAPAAPAVASFHFMQIEQIIGGYCGDPSAQAVQLRMRFAGQNFVSGSRLVAHDAAGENPVILIAFPGNVNGSAAGSRILAATADFVAAGGPEPDFVLDNPIPPAYLPAGKLTFETGAGLVYWSVAWGGASYTGGNTGSTTNDVDGDFNPPFPGVHPYSGNIALRFTGKAGAQSTNNADDYALSVSPATFTNNDGEADTLADCVQNDGFEVIED